MVERLDYCDWASAFFKLGADLRQETEGVIDALSFLLNRLRGPLRSLGISICLQYPLKRDKRAHNNVIRDCESLQVIEILLAQSGSKFPNGGEVGFHRPRNSCRFGGCLRGERSTQ